MKLFHYTTSFGARGIVLDGCIRPSAGNPLTEGMVSPTSDPDRQGHGLPDGREITPQQAGSMLHVVKRERLFCHDHTVWRVSVDIPDDDPSLVSARRRYDETAIFALDIAAWNPADAVPTANRTPRGRG